MAAAQEVEHASRVEWSVPSGREIVGERRSAIHQGRGGKSGICGDRDVRVMGHARHNRPPLRVELGSMIWIQTAVGEVAGDFIASGSAREREVDARDGALVGRDDSLKAFTNRCCRFRWFLWVALSEASYDLAIVDIEVIPIVEVENVLVHGRVDRSI